MAEYNRILIAGNPVLTSGNFTPDNFEYLMGEPGEKGAKGGAGDQGPLGDQGPKGVKGGG